MEDLIELLSEISPYKKVMILIILLWVCIGITALTTGFGLMLSGIVTIVLVGYITKIIK